MGGPRAIRRLGVLTKGRRKEKPCLLPFVLALQRLEAHGTERRRVASIATRELDLMLMASECQVWVRGEVPTGKSWSQVTLGRGHKHIDRYPQILRVCFWSRHLASPCGFSWCLSAIHCPILPWDTWESSCFFPSSQEMLL